MKKKLSLLMIAFLAITAFALQVSRRTAEPSVVYSWATGSENYSETGGTAVASGANDSGDDISKNYIRLKGKNDYSTNIITITLDNALHAGDKINVTGYRNKDAAGKTSGFKAKFDKGGEVASANGTEFVNTNEAVKESEEYGAEPNTCTFDVPEAAAGSTTITLTRSHTATNLYITKIEITSTASEEGGEGQGGEEPAVTYPITATWDFANADIANAAAAFSASTEAGTIVNNGLTLTIEANGKTIRNNGNSIQTGDGVVFKVPVQGKKDVVTVVGFAAPYYAYSVAGVDATEATTKYTATATDVAQGFVEVVNKGQYLISISVTQNEDEQGGNESGDEPHDPVVLTWDYTEKDIPTTGPDNGLYYSGYVNDAAGTNNGLHGVKLNSSGYAFFAKDAVAGKLTLTIGNRKNQDAYAVNVYACTIADGQATKGNLIGEVAVSESPGTGSIDIAADVTGIYIERKTAAEGVLVKVVFKEDVPRTFVDFEIPFETLSADGYTGADLPTGVTFSGTYHDAQHGYQNATLVVPVDGTVKFTISGCRYGNTFDIKNSEGTVLTSLNQKDAGCHNYDAPGDLTYIYVGDPTTLTFSNILYLSYFKAEATEVQEVTITYKDQNGNKLGEKKVFEGDPLGEIPYTEADLTIPEGEKFRGWVYASKVKVKATDIVNGDISVNASVTPIEEAPTVGSIQTYDLTSSIFYPEDHENFSVENGAYYNNHGWDFAAEGSFSVNVTGKAQIVLTLCQYGNGTTIKVTDANGKEIATDVPAKAEADGGTTAINYEGDATTLTFTFAAQTYLHKVTVYNVNSFIEKDDKSDYYIIPAGDAASLIMAINAAANTPNTKIFLPNGTYDLGEAVLTGISGTNVSLIGESMEGVVIKTAPAVELEGLGKADLFNNTSTGLYIQDLTLQNALDYYKAGTGRAPTLHDQGTKTINKNVRHLSYQDTYYSHKVGGLYYFEGGEMHGTVDYLCGNGKAFFEGMKIVNEERSSATISANSELYVFNNCVVENNADKYNLGRAWSDNPVCIYLNTKLLDPSKLESTRWNLSGINCDYSIAGEYNTMDAEGNNITPASNEVTFTKQNTKLQTILTADQAATYTIDYVLGDWATTAKQQATQLEAPAATFENGNVTWTAVDGAIAYLMEKNGEFVGITTETSFAVEGMDAENDELTIRAANSRGGFGEAKVVTGTATSVKAVNAAIERGEQVIFNIAGQRVNKATKGLYIINGKKVVIK